MRTPLANRSTRLVSALALLSLAAAPASAQEYLAASIDASQEVPPNPSTATGAGCFSLDLSTNTVTYHVEFSGLSAPETAAHVHGFAPPGMNAGVLFNLGTGSPKTGSFVLSPAQLPQFLAGETYVNIHSQAFTGGEIRGQIVLQVADRFCFGDGSATPCPCGNTAVDAGCANSTGAGATLRARGVWCTSLDSLVLDADQLPPTSIGLFFVGTSAVNGGAGAPFGDGLRCVTGQVTRMGTKPIQGGHAEFGQPADPPISSFGGTQAGDTRLYQFWYRNVAGPCGGGFNLTNAVRLTWGV